MKHYILDASHDVIEVDLLECRRWHESRELERTAVGLVLVLTSFAGIDISFGDGPPAFFETRVLDGIDELECVDSSSWAHATAVHRAMVERWSGWADAALGAAQRVLAGR